MKGKSGKIHRPPSQERFIQVRTLQYSLNLSKKDVQRNGIHSAKRKLGKDART
jgi:hypothetical protein